MKKSLITHLVCPDCLPREYSLRLTSDKEEDGDIITGKLSCSHCKNDYLIQNGIAKLLPSETTALAGGQLRYEDQSLTNRYLWSHFGDLIGEKTWEGERRSGWEEFCSSGGGLALETGCAVGRLTFELSSRYEFSIGCDLSLRFVETARKLSKLRQISFNLPVEGKLTERFELKAPDNWCCDRIEFIVADALRLPFASGSFQQVASINLLDRVSYPLAHLYELNRVAADHDSSLLLADPFSWENSPAPEEKWLGGTALGTYPGFGLENVRGLLEGKNRVLQPSWVIRRSGSVAWRLRSHRNHYEVITSDYLEATR